LEKREKGKTKAAGKITGRRNRVKKNQVCTKSQKRRGQTAIEYVMMISATVVFISLTAFFIKTRVIAP